MPFNIVESTNCFGALGDFDAHGQMTFQVTGRSLELLSTLCMDLLTTAETRGASVVTIRFATAVQLIGLVVSLSRRARAHQVEQYYIGPNAITDVIDMILRSGAARVRSIPKDSVPAWFKDEAIAMIDAELVDEAIFVLGASALKAMPVRSLGATAEGDAPSLRVHTEDDAPSEGAEATPSAVAPRRRLSDRIGEIGRGFATPDRSSEIWGSLTWDAFCGKAGHLDVYGMVETAMGGLVHGPSIATESHRYAWLLELGLKSSLGDEVELLSGRLQLPNWVEAGEAAIEVAAQLQSRRMPQELLLVGRTKLEARRWVTNWIKGEASDIKLASDNVIRAINWQPNIIEVLGGSAYNCTASPGEALTAIQALATKCEITTTAPTIPDLVLLNVALKFMRATFSRETSEGVARLTKALEMLSKKTVEYKLTSKVETDAPVMRGYARNHHAALYHLLGLDHFVSFTVRLETMIRDSDVHAHQCIAEIVKSPFGMLRDALTGHKEEVESVPVVKLIAQTLRVHGPTWMGQMGCELVMPTHFTPLSYPPLVQIWKDFCSGDLDLDVYNDLIIATKTYYNSTDQTVIPAVRVADSQRYRSLIRNCEILQRVGRESNGFFTMLNFTGYELILQNAVDQYNSRATRPRRPASASCMLTSPTRWRSGQC